MSSKIVVEVWSSIRHLFEDEQSAESAGKLLLAMEVPEGESLKDVLLELAVLNPRFGEVMFDSHTGEPADYITVVINGRLPELLDGYDTLVSDGDQITLVQAYQGG